MITSFDILLCCTLLCLLFLFSFYMKSTKETYFTFTANYWLIGSSLMAANIGSEHFVGQIAAASSTGMGVVLYEWYAAYLLLLLGWVFCPYYRDMTTVPEYIESRYDKTTRVLCAFITLFAATVVKISASVYAASILFETILGWDAQLSVALVLVFTGLYTIVGGLSAIMWTDLVQLCVFLIGGLTASVICLNVFGGFFNLIDLYYMTDNGYLLKLFRGLDDPHYSPLGMLVGQGIASIWYWNLDQEMCQRANSGKTIDDSRLGTAIAGFLKLLPFFIIVIPGLTARMLYETCIQGIDIPGNEKWCLLDMSDGEEANKAYAYLLIHLFPTGLSGIILGAIFASMTASLSACFHASSTVFSLDVYKRIIRPKATHSELVNVGRLFTALMILVGIVWTKILKSQHESIYLVTQMVMNHISPVLTTVVVWGMITPRITSLAANTGLILGSLLGCIRLCIHLMSKEVCNQFSTPTHLGGPLFACMHFNHFSILLSGVVTVLIWFISLIQPENHKITPPLKFIKESRRSPLFQRVTTITSMALFICVTSLILIFHFAF